VPSLAPLIFASGVQALLTSTHLPAAPRAGWGDRLLGALATPGVKRYLAADPNPRLARAHSDMVQRFAPLAGDGSAPAFEVRGVPFEDLVVPAADAAAGFNLVLTSPPYFDLELYAPPAASGPDHDALQSTSRHPTQAAWLQGWYFPALAKAWSFLQPGGHMAIYINDHASKATPGGGAPALPDIDICVPMLQFAADRLPGCLWVGTLGIQGETGQVRPLWVWRREGGDAAAPLPPIYDLVSSAAGAGNASGGSSASAAVGGGGIAGAKRRWGQ
jgi:hypothetical protein